jgi:predicted phage terminase large subunit-like protein
MKLRDREALKDWEAYRKALMAATSIEPDEDFALKQKRIAQLCNNFEAFCKYYFPNYFASEFALFQKRFAKKVIDSNVIYISRAWSRAHAKSVIADLFLPLYLKFSGRMKNMLLVSYSHDNAERLLMPLKINLESNQRIINDFDKQQGISKWNADDFITANGNSFRAIGSGESPRGTSNEAARPDFIVVDDIDEDELCRNPKRLDDLWDWVSGALYGCFDITGRKRFIVVGNIIAKDSIVVRASGKADDHEQINILDDNKQPSWKERFTLQECQYMIEKMGYRLSQREYFNNPISEGKVFKKEWIQYMQLPKLNRYRFLMAYLDPGFKKTKGSDTKALVLVGLYEGKFHVQKVFCAQASVEEMVEWGYALDKEIKSNGGSYTFKMEEVFLQDLLFKDFAAAAKLKGFPLPVSGDKRKKPDKDARIEALSGYFERGDVYFNEEEKDNHHMQALIEQLLTFEPRVRSKKDGPDALEGAMHLLQQSVSLSADIGIGSRQLSRHKIGGGA